MALTAREKLVAGRLLCREKAPYFRAAILALIPREAPGLGTVGVTDRGVLMVDYDVIETWSIQEVAGALLHEVGHLLRDHPGRCNGRHPRLFNIAGDLAMNTDVVKIPGVALPQGALFPADFGWDEGLTAEAYYSKVYDRVQEQAEQGNDDVTLQDIMDPQEENRHADEEADGQGEGKGEGKGKGQGKGQGKAPGKEPGKGKGDLSQAGQKPQCGNGWCGSGAGRPLPDEPDPGEEGGGRSKAELGRVRKAVAEAIRAEAQKTRGSVPGGWEVWAEEELGAPKVRWQDKLARLTRAAIAWRPGAIDHRYDRPSRRQAGVGFGPGRPILPCFRAPIPRVGVGIDTSGSMSGGELTMAVRETRGILLATGADVEFCACDAAVHELRPVRDHRQVAKLLKGGGGTDFGPIVEAFCARKNPPEVLIIITDGCGPAPAAPPQGVKVIWVLVGKHRSRPYGSAGPISWGDFIEIDE